MGDFAGELFGDGVFVVAFSEVLPHILGRSTLPLVCDVGGSRGRCMRYAIVR